MTAWFSQSIQTGITGLGLGWVGATVISGASISIRITLPAPRPAIIAMFGAFFAAGVALGALITLALLLAFSSSLMMSLTHDGTGTAPIIFGFRAKHHAERMVAAGAILSVVNLLVLVLVGSAGGSCWATSEIPVCSQARR
ncbi:anion permease [Candidatus Skiveiella danica]|uniref:anion permease n=1 Tax=Candidatus Skiveiella danica TaxID=3386177 RepID=UPI0039B98AC5